jgi:hypothetical protein
MTNKTNLGITAAAIVTAGIALTACSGGTTVTKAASPSTHAAPARTSAPAPTPTTPPNTGPLGTTFKVTGTNDSGNSMSYDVTAVKVDQHSALVPYDSLTNPSDHLAAVEFKITGVSGQSSDDANNDAAALTGNTEQVSPADNSTPDGGNWSYGEFTVSPGQSATGWVTFELPPGQSIASVQWVPGLGSTAGTWTVGNLSDR